MIANRQRLPNRRQCYTADLEFRGKPVVVSVGYYPDGRAAEIFIYTHKLSSDAHDAARDSAVIMSIAFQEGSSPHVMRDAITRLENGDPASLPGLVLDFLVSADWNMGEAA